MMSGGRSVQLASGGPALHVGILTTALSCRTGAGGVGSLASAIRRVRKMNARVTSLSGSPADVDAGVANFRENVVPFTREQGGRGALLLVDRQTGNAIAITLWEDEEALRASEERASTLRADAA